MSNNNITLKDDGSIAIDGVDIPNELVFGRMLVKIDDEVYASSDSYVVLRKKKLHRLVLWQASFNNAKEYIDTISSINTNPIYNKNPKETHLILQALKKSAVISYCSPFTPGGTVLHIEKNAKMQSYQDKLKKFAREQFQAIWRWQDFDVLHNKIMDDRNDNIAHRSENGAGFHQLHNGFVTFNMEQSSLTPEDLSRMSGIAQLYSIKINEMQTAIQTEIKTYLNSHTATPPPPFSSPTQAVSSHQPTPTA